MNIQNFEKSLNATRLKKNVFWITQNRNFICGLSNLKSLLILSGVIKTFETPTFGLHSPLGLLHCHHPLQQFNPWAPPGDVSQWPSKSLELSSRWQMHRYYIYNKYSVNKLTTLLIPKEPYKQQHVNKIKCIYWFNNKIVIGLQRKASKC